MPTLLDTRIPLEIPQVNTPPPGDTIFLPVLFDLATNSLELGRVDATVFPPAASFVPIATGNIFALGAIDQSGSQVGFSFIDGNFDLRFATCTPPCDSVSDNLVNAGTWIDSASAASDGDFFVAGLDNGATHSVSVFYSSNGSSWFLLNTFTPAEPGGVYDNFHGGKRIGLVVDPTATSAASTENCILVEVKPTTNSTTLEVECRNGAGSPQFISPIDSDVPNAGASFDRFIETRLGERRAPLPQDRIFFGAYSHRQTGAVRSFSLDPNGPTLFGPTDIGSVPGGSNFFNVSATSLEGSREVRTLWPNNIGVPQHDVETILGSTSYVLPRSGPDFSDVGICSILNWDQTGNPADAFLYAFILLPAGEGTGPGLGVSTYLLPLFEDGFETGNSIRWSATAP